MQKFNVLVNIEVWGEDEDEVFGRMYRELEQHYGGGNVYIEEVEAIEKTQERDEIQYADGLESDIVWG